MTQKEFDEVTRKVSELVNQIEEQSVKCQTHVDEVNDADDDYERTDLDDNVEQYMEQLDEAIGVLR